jgi:outer membrane receptor protein involved in Fe transport
VDLYYRNFDLSLFLFGMQNTEVFNLLRRNCESMAFQDLHHNKSSDFAANYWRPDNPSTKYIRADLNDANFNSRVSTWWLEDASFLRLKDIQLGYTLPLPTTMVKRFRVYVSAINLFTITPYTGTDPEAPINTGGFDSGAYPLPRSYTLGLQVDF